ncbi:MAG: hypothetical protein JWL77_6151 [Chthonomonadaceae bacterium]|nr:hypothetical protein [Chthonomonadaceae bacterium]
MKQRLQNLLFAIGIFLLPVLAFADDDDKPQPMSEHDKMIQSWAWVMIAALIIVPIAWYQYRKWSILRSGSQSHGSGHPQD